MHNNEEPTQISTKEEEEQTVKISAPTCTTGSQRYVRQSRRWFYCSDEDCEYAMNKLFKYASRENCEQHIRMHHNEEPSQISTKEEEAQTVKISAPTSTTGSQRYVRQSRRWFYC